jgi:hypothetical protein
MHSWFFHQLKVHQQIGREDSMYTSRPPKNEVMRWIFVLSSKNFVPLKKKYIGHIAVDEQNKALTIDGTTLRPI